MDETLRKVDEFHKAFGIKTPRLPAFEGLTTPVIAELGKTAQVLKTMSEELQASSKIHDKSALLLRLHLIVEEVSELANGIAKGDAVECLDALCDIRYVVDGTCLTLGLQDHFMEGFREVHRSNMSKLENGKPVLSDTGRVIKGKYYSKPDLFSVFLKTRDWFLKQKQVIEEFNIPKSWDRYRVIKWGNFGISAVYWIAKVPYDIKFGGSSTNDAEFVGFKKDDLIVYREIVIPRPEVKWPVENICDIIKATEKDNPEKFSGTFIEPAAFFKDKMTASVSVADCFAENGIYCINPANYIFSFSKALESRMGLDDSDFIFIGVDYSNIFFFDNCNRAIEKVAIYQGNITHDLD